MRADAALQSVAVGSIVLTLIFHLRRTSNRVVPHGVAEAGELRERDQDTMVQLPTDHRHTIAGERRLTKRARALAGLPPQRSCRRHNAI
jgi:hypothetical protein